MGSGITTYFNEGEAEREAVNKLRNLSEKLIDRTQYYILHIETTRLLLACCKELKFRQECVDDNADGNALALLLGSILYHSQELGITKIPVGDELKPFRLDTLAFPRMSRPRPTTTSITSAIDWSTADASNLIDTNTAFMLTVPCPEPSTLWGRFDNYLHLLSRAKKDLEADIGSDIFQVKDLNGTLDKLIYRSKNGTDLLRCRVADLDALGITLAAKGFTLQEDGTNGIGVRVQKYYTSIKHWEPPMVVPIWIEVSAEAHVSEEEHLGYEVERMKAGFQMEVLQGLGTVQSMEKHIVPHELFVEASAVIHTQAHQQRNLQMAMMASKYGATNN